MDCESSFAESSDDQDNPHQYCDKEFTFGTLRGACYISRSDFGLELLDFVEAGNKTGFLCRVSRQSDKEKR